MSDFETHDRGTAQELRLSRSLVCKLALVVESGDIKDKELLKAFDDIMQFYEKHLHE